MRTALRRVAELLARRADSRLKGKPSDFTRSGPLRPEFLITLLMYLVADGGRRGYRRLLEGFWEDAHEHDLDLPSDEPVSAAAFCKARRKLRPEVVRLLLHDVDEAFQRSQGAQHRIGGRRVLAIDGTKIALQRAPALSDAFGGPHGGFTPMAMVTTLLDVVAKSPVDATVLPYASSERAQLSVLLDRVKPRDVVVLDRGYPSFQVIETFLKRGIDFVMGMVLGKGGFPAIDAFVASRAEDADIVLAPTPGSPVRVKGPFKLRVVRSRGPDDTPRVLLTSLPRSEFSGAQIQDLYRRRWEVELFFRLEKQGYLGHDQFHARTREGVEQEVYALMLFVALTRTLMCSAAVLSRVPDDQQISQKGAIFAVTRVFARLLLVDDPKRARRLLKRLLDRLGMMLEKKRPGRSSPRRSYKPRPRWGPKGKTGQRRRVRKQRGRRRGG